MVATHSGLFRAGARERRVERVGDRRQDTMGFSVVGPRRFVGSGHPDARDDLPPLLGLIRSSDAGRTWQPVSLMGQADFHVLRTAGRLVYGVNSADGRLLVSADSGRTWRPRVPPGAVVDLLPLPGRSGEVIAATDDGLHLSRDSGATWRPLASGRAGLLAAAGGATQLIDQAGVVHRSTNGGKSFDVVGDIGGRPAALTADGTDLYVALHTNEVKQSQDGGRTWRLRAAAES